MKNDCLIVIVMYAQNSRNGIVNDYHLKPKNDLEGRDLDHWNLRLMLKFYIMQIVLVYL